MRRGWEDDTHFDGLRAIHTLAGEDIPVNCTLIFTPEQALLAARAGPGIVSPFSGRVDDLLRETNGLSFEKTDYFPAAGLEEGEVIDDNGVVSGVDPVEQCVDILSQAESPAEVLAASIRNPRQAREVALAGAHISTLPFDVLRELLVHVKTVEGMEKFTRDVVPDYAELLA